MVMPAFETPPLALTQRHLLGYWVLFVRFAAGFGSKEMDEAVANRENGATNTDNYFIE